MGDYVNIPDHRAASQKPGESSPHSGRRVYRMVTGTLAVLCILQASLNIILRLSHNNTDPSNSIQGPKTSCPEGWQRFRSSCYYMGPLRSNWSSGKEYCKREGGDLVILNSPEKKDFINSLFGCDEPAWIGLEKTSGGWMWVDGNNLNTTYWVPPLRTSNVCMMLGACSYQEVNWYPVDCSSHLKPVCKKPDT